MARRMDDDDDDLSFRMKKAKIVDHTYMIVGQISINTDPFSYETVVYTSLDKKLALSKLPECIDNLSSMYGSNLALVTLVEVPLDTTIDEGLVNEHAIETHNINQ